MCVYVFMCVSASLRGCIYVRVNVCYYILVHVPVCVC